MPSSKQLSEIAESTLQTIERGSMIYNNVNHDLTAKVSFTNANTRYYSPDALSAWKANVPRRVPTAPPRPTTEISVLEISTLDAARLLSSTLSSRSASYGRIAVLNFANATSPGGGFLKGAQAQEESIARSSTLYPSLMTAEAQQFYTLHMADRNKSYYHHAMIFSPAIVIFRNDAGKGADPFEMDVITSAAVNAGVARSQEPDAEKKIEGTMRERMARILFLCEQQGSKNIVLGSYGTGAFENRIDIVAKIWADLLTVKGARFKGSFDRVIFAVLGRETFDSFKQHFEKQSRR